MRLLADLATNHILQVEPPPELLSETEVNGKYAVAAPDNTVVDVTSASYLVPVDGGDVSSEGFDALLALYPMYDYIVFNPLLTAANVADLDLAATVDNTGNTVLPPPWTAVYGCRTQVGRGVGPQLGNVPNSTAVLPANRTTVPPRPGLLVTDAIDVSAQVPLGTTAFAVYWKIYRFSTSQDIMSSYGVFNGVNQPAIRSILETEQEPTGLVVALSNDNGANYVPVGRLQSAVLAAPGNQLRLAFFNTTPNDIKLYLASYAIMF